MNFLRKSLRERKEDEIRNRNIVIASAAISTAILYIGFRLLFSGSNEKPVEPVVQPSVNVEESKPEYVPAPPDQVMKAMDRIWFIDKACYDPKNHLYFMDLTYPAEVKSEEDKEEYDGDIGWFAIQEKVIQYVSLANGSIIITNEAETENSQMRVHLDTNGLQCINGNPGKEEY